MKSYTIQSAINNAVLFEGPFPSFAACAEAALAAGVKLEGADLSHKNLGNACFDDAVLRGADFSGSNLTGANLSEADITGANFSDSDLYNTCFAYSTLKNCNFEGASFGATDITASDLSNSVFSTLSCFSLDFMLAKKMAGSRFKSAEGQIVRMGKPPIVIRGLSDQIMAFTESHWLRGMECHPYKDDSERPRALLPVGRKKS